MGDLWEAIRKRFRLDRTAAAEPATGSGAANQRDSRGANERPVRVGIVPVSLEDAATFLPRYLSPEQRADLFAQLREFPANTAYYTQFAEGMVLQGDGFDQVEYFDIDREERRRIKVSVLSNSCDISPENERHLPSRVIVAPLVRFGRFVQILKEAGVDHIVIDEKLKAIRRQEITNIFYLPRGGELAEEYLVMLDNLQAQPLGRFFKNQERKRLFTLSQAGFWVLLIKLAIHFCRAQENVARGASGAAA